MRNSTFCPICNNREISDLSASSLYHYCKNCQTAWLKKFTELKYEDNYYRGKSSIFSKLFQPATLFFYWVRGKYAGKGRKNLWIDIGAGEGGFLKTVNADSKIGVEISSIGRKVMGENNLYAITPKEFLESRDLKASVISFWHVLEHTKRPWDYLNTAQKNLSEDGNIVIGIPNITSWEFQYFKNDWFHLVPQYHIWHFSLQSVRIMLKNAGFVILGVDYFSIEHHPTGLLQSLINKTSGTHNILHKLVKRETDLTNITLGGAFWVIFWLSIGLPIAVGIWIVNSFLHKSGTLVIIASLVKK